MWRVHLKSTAGRGHAYSSSRCKQGAVQGVLKRLGQCSPCELSQLAPRLPSRTEVQPEEKLLEEKQNWTEQEQQRWRKEMDQIKRCKRKNSQEISENKPPFYWTCEKRKEREFCEVEKLSELSFCLKFRKTKFMKKWVTENIKVKSTEVPQEKREWENSNIQHDRNMCSKTRSKL